MLAKIGSEFTEWFTHLIRWIPGKCGFVVRYYFYKHYLASCGHHVNISVGCQMRDRKNITIGNKTSLGIFTQLYASGNGNERIFIGNNVTLNYNVMVNADNGGSIRIGNNCIVGPNVVFRTSNHVYSSRLIPMREQGHRPGTIVLKDDVWIGSNVTVIGNVVIGQGAIVGAGSMVNKDVCDFSIVAGVPARMIGNR